MKFDMHTHTKEGSLDAKAELVSIARKLKEKGFQGMLITDHNSYKGYQMWEYVKEKYKDLEDFVILKGIEYDTVDGGHILVVLPDQVHCKLLELRGMSVKKLEELVHGLGGILGPAHPYGTGFFALMHNWYVQRHLDIIPKFDFIESFNSCSDKIANKLAKELAARYKKPEFAGSDAHHLRNLGTAFVEFTDNITCNNDLIRAIRRRQGIYAGSCEDDIEWNEPNRIIRWMGIVGYWIYNKFGSLMYAYSRIKTQRQYKHTVVYQDKEMENNEYGY
ncbi:MAG: PHP domain-containing protein [Lachnospiraceae bacterium]|nr:PHP domain-containing protein [Lachnospiraceae bacterium]MDD3615376.1 PHP domain-containing protein [Lachnospiraceae bacterium]